MSKQWTLFVTAPTLLAIAAGAAAQVTDDRPGLDQPRTPDAQVMHEKKAGDKMTQQHKLLKGSDVIGAAVNGASGDKVAEIKDLVVDTKKGHVTYAVLARGGVLGIGEERHVVPWDAIKLHTAGAAMDKDDADLVFSFEDDRLLEGGPSIKEGERVDMGDPAWNERIFRHYGREPYWKKDGMADRPGVDDQQAGALARLDMHKASDLMDEDVENLQDNDLGDLEDIVIDARTGRVLFGIVAAGGFLGIGQEYAAVPFSAFEVRPEDPADAADDDIVLVLNLDEERFQQAPKFSADNWPDFSDRTWGEPVHRYYGTEPYWLDDEMDLDDLDEPGDAGGAGMLGDPTGQELFRTGQSTRVSGTIRTVQDDQRLQGVGEGVHITVETDTGPMLVHLAPRNHLDKKGLELNEGDQVSIRGAKVTVEGREVVLAQSVESDGNQTELRDENGRPLWESDR